MHSDLNKWIAEHQGWRFVTPPYMNPTSCLIFDPDGREMFHQSGTWTRVFTEGTETDVIPDFEHDLNASLSLVADRPFEIIHFVMHNKDYYRVDVPILDDAVMGEKVYAEAATLEELPSAICEAYRALHEREGVGDEH
jgi:hypothetical protein